MFAKQIGSNAATYRMKRSNSSEILAESNNESMTGLRNRSNLGTKNLLQLAREEA